MNQEQAEILALQALTHMAQQETILVAYLKLTGMTFEELRDSAADGATLGSILDYFLQDEKRLLAFCAAAEIPPQQIASARAALPGGDPYPHSM